MRFHFSGVDRPSFAQILGQEQAAGMVNILDLRPPLLEMLRKYPGQWVMDSGAFQGNTMLEAYAQAIQAYADIFEWFANLDVIGNQHQSDENYKRLLSLLPPQLHHKVLWIYQYSPETLKDLPAYIRQYGPFIGIGGLVPYVAQSVERAIEIVEKIGAMLTEEDAEAHFFGFGNFSMVKKFANKKYARSADSSTWLIAVKNKQLLNERGDRISYEQLGFRFKADECLAQNVRVVNGWTQAPQAAVLKPKKSILPTLFDALLPQEEVQDASIA